MLQHLRSSFFSFCSILVRTIASLSINKLLALYYGPNGITLYAHFQNLISIVTTVPDGGINIGAVKFLANSKPESLHFVRYFWAGALLNLLCVVVALVLIFSFPGYYLEVFWQETNLSDNWLWLIFFGFSCLLLTYNLYILAVFLAKRLLPWYVTGTSLLSIAGVSLLLFSQGDWELGQVLLGMLLAQSAMVMVLLPMLFAKGLVPSFKKVRIPVRVYKAIGKYIVMALSAVICLKLTNFFVRDFIITRFDLYETGLWQAVVRVSDNYSMVYSSVIGMLYYPRMAALVNEQDALQRFVRQTFYIVFPGLAIALLLVYWLRSWLLLLLFNQDFVQAEYLFDYQLLGDFFRMWSAILTNLIVVRAHVKLYIGWQISSALLYVGLVYVLVEPYGLEGVTVAHSIRYGVVLLLSMLYYYKYIRP